jgi:hypothetical protein
MTRRNEWTTYPAMIKRVLKKHHGIAVRNPLSFTPALSLIWRHINVALDSIVVDYRLFTRLCMTTWQPISDDQIITANSHAQMYRLRRQVLLASSEIWIRRLVAPAHIHKPTRREKYRYTLERSNPET